MEEETYSKIRLNSLVKVKLNENGISILRSSHEYHKSKITNPIYYEMFGDFELSVDENEYTEMKLWEIFYYFGDYCFYEGTQEDERCLPFDPEIVINNEYLVLVEKKQEKKLRNKK